MGVGGQRLLSAASLSWERAGAHCVAGGVGSRTRKISPPRGLKPWTVQPVFGASFKDTYIVTEQSMIWSAHSQGLKNYIVWKEGKERKLSSILKIHFAALSFVRKEVKKSKYTVKRINTHSDKRALSKDFIYCFNTTSVHKTQYSTLFNLQSPFHLPNYNTWLNRVISYYLYIRVGFCFTAG